MNTLTLIFLSFLLVGSCIHTGTVHEVKKLKNENDSLRGRVIELNHQIQILSDEIKNREDEISFLGHMCDSLKNKN